MANKSTKYHYFYKITNNLNGHFYYGVHNTNDLNDGYMGSGTRLHYAYKKYGIENFTKEILKFFDTSKEAFEYEAITLVISKIFTKIKFPPLLLIIGIVVTALVQSSSATTSIVIIMVGSRAISFDNGLYLALGATIGTVVTTLLASIGTSNKAKKTAFIAFMYRLISGLIIMILVWCLEVLITDFFTKNFKTNELALAVFIIFHNILSLIIFLPILKWFISWFDNCFKEDEKIDKKNILYINDSLLKTPTVAMIQVKLEIKHMAELSKKKFRFRY